MKYIYLALVSTLLICCKNSQQVPTLWQSIDNSNDKLSANSPSKFLTYQLDDQMLGDQLSKCGAGLSQAAIIEFPDPTGKITQFSIWKSSTVSDELLKKYPGLQTYQGEMTNNNIVKIRLEYPSAKLQAMVFGGDTDTWFISPADNADNYLIYNKKSLPADAKNFWSDKIIN